MSEGPEPDSYALTTAEGAAPAPQASALDPAVVEQAVVGGDLSRLSPAQRVSYYRAVCDSLGLSPST
jgi:hypothetical protein